MDLIATLKRPEGKTLEFKRDLSSPRGIVRTVVAFANTAGGVLLIGVEDKTGFVRGVADVLAAEERLANILADTVTPQVMPDIEVLPWRDVYVIAAEVFPSPRRPHRVRAEGANGVYVRVGSTNRRADPPLVDEMRRFANRQAYDEEPLPQLRSEAVDFRAASEWFAPKRKLRRSDLDTLRLVARDQARKVPTVGGILLFGSEKERHFPDAWIQAGRFRGENRVHIADQRDIRGHAPALVERATAFVVEHLSCGAHIEGTRREDRWNVPPVAVREASSTPWHTRTTRSAAARSESPSSRTEWKWRTRPTALRPHSRRLAAWRLQTPQSRDCPGLPGTRLDGAPQEPVPTATPSLAQPHPLPRNGRPVRFAHATFVSWEVGEAVSSA